MQIFAPTLRSDTIDRCESEDVWTAKNRITGLNLTTCKASYPALATNPLASLMVRTHHAIAASLNANRVNAILLNILRKADLEGEGEKFAVARMERYFVGFTQALWDCAK